MSLKEDIEKTVSEKNLHIIINEEGISNVKRITIIKDGIIHDYTDEYADYIVKSLSDAAAKYY